MKRTVYHSGDAALHEQILQLLSESFGSQYREYYQLQLEHLASPALTKILSDEEGRLAAFTQVVEYRFRTAPNTPKFRAAYLYSVCTARAYQGQGVMGSFLPQILSELKEAGYAFAFLVPAEVWLIDYYRRLGFQWMSDQVYQTVPKETCPLLRPIDDACDYLKAVDRLEGKSVSQHRFEQQRFGEWQLLQPPVIGWMAVSLQPGFQIPSETCLLQPLT